MKRRIKMGMTIAFICLAVGMLSFGVYAATTVSFSVSTSISYKITSLYLDINASVSGGSLASPITYSYNSITAGGNPNDGSTLVWDKNTVSDGSVSVSPGIGNLSFASTEKGKTLTFSFEFENNGEKTITGTFSENVYPTTKVTQAINYGTGNSISIASKGKQTITVAYTLKSFGFSLSSEKISLQFNFSD